MDTLHRLGVPETQENANALLAQFEAEEPPGTVAAYNPGNIEVATAQSFGYTNVGSWSLASQIATFPNFAEGVRAYATALKRIAPNAVADLKAQRPASVTVGDIGSSGWGTSGSLMQQILASGEERGAAERSTVAGSATGGRNTLRPPPSSGGDSIIPSIPGLPGAGSILGGLGSSITGAFSSVEGFLLRGGKILLGIVLIVAAIWIAMGHPTSLAGLA